MDRLPSALLDLLFPARCAACDAWLPLSPEPRAVCPTCEGAFEPLPPEACPRCADPGAGPLGCPGCGTSPPPFEATLAGWRYGGPLQEAILRFKFGGRPDLARPLGGLLAGVVIDQAPAVDLVVPVPLHPERLRARGFDQAERLARPVGRVLGRPVCLALRRVRPTPRQVGARRSERQRNMRGAFEVRSRPSARLAGRSVLLVDDVLTTGATAAAAARALRRAGARRVLVAVLARAG